MSPVAADTADTALSARALLRWQFELAHDLLDAPRLLDLGWSHRSERFARARVPGRLADLDEQGATDASLAALRDEAFDLLHGERTASLLSALLLTLSMRRGEIACVIALEQQPSTAEQ